MTNRTNQINSRRGFLQAGLGTVAAAAAVVAASPARAQKIEPTMVQYQKMPKGEQHCKICAQWEEPNACKIVSGVIDPNGWCAVYAAKT